MPPPGSSHRPPAIRVAVVALAAVTAVATAPRLAEADGRRDLEDGIAFYEALDTERAEARLEAAARAWDLSASDRSTAYLYLGMLAYELGRLRKADAAWRAALTLNLEQRPPASSSPKIRQAFERVRKALPDPPPPPPLQDPPPSAEDAAGDARDAQPDSLGSEKTMLPPGGGPQPGSPRRGSDEARPPPELVPPPVVPPPEQPAGLDLSQPSVEADDEDDGVSPWLWVGLGGAALAATAAVVAVVLSGGGEESECAQGGGGCVSIQLQ